MITIIYDFGEGDIISSHIIEDIKLLGGTKWWENCNDEDEVIIKQDIKITIIIEVKR